jgi:hypothetical protein
MEADMNHGRRILIRGTSRLLKTKNQLQDKRIVLPAGKQLNIFALLLLLGAAEQPVAFMISRKGK